MRVPGRQVIHVLRRGRGPGLYRLRLRRPLTEELASYDVDVSWWVTPDAYDAGYYAKVHQALQRWVTEDYPFTRPHYSNVRIPPA